jgi:hypothetical protein
MHGERDLPLHVIAGQISGALELLTDLLREAIAQVWSDLEGRGIDPTQDPANFSSNVRLSVREQLRHIMSEELAGNSNMSPVHLVLGPHQIRMLHASKGELPRPATKARTEYYRSNDTPLFELNIYAASDVVDIDPELEAIEEAALVLLWDSERDQLTQLTLCRPSLTSWPGETYHLTIVTDAEEDLGIEPKRREHGETGTEGAEDE